MNGFHFALLGGVLGIFCFGSILTLIRKHRARTSQEADEAIKMGTLYTVILMTIYIALICIAKIILK